jgi:hypothetical protein
MLTTRLRRLAQLTPALALLALPAAGNASVMFGAQLHNQDGTVRQPANSGPHSCDESGNDNPTPPCTHVAIQYGDTGAAGNNVTAPKTGWITNISVVAGAPGKFRLKLVKVSGLNAPMGSAQAKVDTVGPWIHVQGLGSNYPIQMESFKVHVRVHKGDYLAVDTNSISIVTCESGSNEQLVFTPTLSLGNPLMSSSANDDCTMLIRAKIR